MGDIFQNTLLSIIFILPGYLSFLLVKTFKDGYGKKSDTLDKAIYSLIFDVPIFLLTIYLLNNYIGIWFIKFFFKQYKGLKTLNDLNIFFDGELNRLFALTILVLLSAIIIGCLWMLIIYFIGSLNNLLRRRKIFLYTDLWLNCFGKVKDSIPLKVFRNNGEKLVMQGFLEECSVKSDDKLQLKLFKIDFFEKCFSEHNLLDEIDFEYYDVKNDLKITVYKLDKINALISNEQEGDETKWIRSKMMHKKIKQITDKIFQLVKVLQKKILPKLKKQSLL